ncbi:MAG: hypothetical protein HY456_00660 [Parcubacteria group bacterium]|nr:hypothetical protein [Parcubacteria group bacterium]
MQSLQKECGPYGIKILQFPLDIPEPRSSDVKEIADAKIRFAYERLKKPVAALDAGFYIHALNGFPRAFVNFTLETIGLGGILTLVRGKNRDCEFRECLAYLDDALNEPRYFMAHVRGRLAFEPKGTLQKHHWSPLSLIFVPEGNEKTLAEMSYDEYLEWREFSNKESTSKLFVEWFAANRCK